jgi:acyl-CoA thioesterase YciA
MDIPCDPTLRVTLMPRDTNRHGTIFGGIIMSHIDLAGAIEARKTCGPLNFVTVALDHVVFHKPVFLGDVVSLYTETLKVGRTSVTTRVIVDGGGPGRPFSDRSGRRLRRRRQGLKPVPVR